MFYAVLFIKVIFCWLQGRIDASPKTYLKLRSSVSYEAFTRAINRLTTDLLKSTPNQIIKENPV